MQKVTGVGGVFIRARDPQAMKDWYEKHLGIPFGSQLYVAFPWVNEKGPEKPGSTVFSFFPQDTDYFQPSGSSFMINFRVQDLDALLETLKQEGVSLIGEPMAESYGKFAWIMDPEGNKIELWEPIE